MKGNRTQRFDRRIIIEACGALCAQEQQSTLRFRDASDIRRWLARNGHRVSARTLQNRITICVKEGLLIPRPEGGWRPT